MQRRHQLLVFRALSRRLRVRLLWLGLLLLALGLFDLLVRPVLGPQWFLVWAALAAVAGLWLYYAVLMRRAAVIIRPRHLVLQGPLRRVKISYGRIESATSTQLARHFSPRELAGAERALLDPFLHLTCILLELNSFPRPLRYARLWYPRWLLSPRQPGLLLNVPDWMALSRDIEVARTAWHEHRRRTRRGDRRTLASRILDY